jgi:hypothetical protein
MSDVILVLIVRVGLNELKMVYLPELTCNTTFSQ